MIYLSGYRNEAGRRQLAEVVRARVEGRYRPRAGTVPQVVLVAAGVICPDGACAL